MSSARNRSQSEHSPQVKQRILQHDLEGAGEALTAFDGFKSSGPVLQAMVLKRPRGPSDVTTLSLGPVHGPMSSGRCWICPNRSL